MDLLDFYHDGAACRVLDHRADFHNHLSVFPQEKTYMAEHFILSVVRRLRDLGIVHSRARCAIRADIAVFTDL